MSKTEKMIRDLAERFWAAPVDSAEWEFLWRQIWGVYRRGDEETQGLIEELTWYTD